MTGSFFAVLAVSIIAFSIVFVAAVARRNNSIVDAFWGLGFTIVAIFSFFAFGGHEFYQVVVTLLVALWGMRLSVRIFARNRGQLEDWRYAHWRKIWNPHWFYVRSFAQVFLFQAVLCFIILLPVIFLDTHAGQLRAPILYAAGLAVWVVGFLFEAVGDFQLDGFKKSKPAKGAVLGTGLWRFTRHPNYFGESTQWWGIWLLALSLGLGAWWTAVSPAVITFLLLKVSGVPLLEQRMSQNPAYRKYMAVTNKFVPGLPWRSQKKPR